ncbi:P-loop containing nucleoside triphosphate hydrolase protein [Lentithecium fluviatile CBS 122367]|uniref:P-loop containing nucleoside triphosphate hydrolase protein n=1 Tax=Lentithecium fluviatile CBS 122367 TaxID=1168545 RepID=A0A6G1IKF4_9PLEO|nr:P-loop containing nucleoside triphosphate hydrolase protein [Lentithecium fluviatile CBS 122367]
MPKDEHNQSVHCADILGNEKTEKEKGSLGDKEMPSTVFHWRNANYQLQTGDGTKDILTDMNGWVEPACQTLIGVVTGEIYVGGYERDASFQSRMGYVQQDDLLLPTSTVREALRYSALLRQPRETSQAEKLAYVETVISMLDMEPYAEGIVGIPGKGLNVEQHKRLTIAVELVAKPNLLLFLDEPTSGLDSQTAWSICMLLRRLANNGQVIICTIHQPPSQLFFTFDRLLLLEKGGKTLYFGDIGHDASILIQYFEKHGASPCPPWRNPAEWVLDATSQTREVNDQQDMSSCEWSRIWDKSFEKQEVLRHLTKLQSPPLGDAPSESPQPIKICCSAIGTITPHGETDLSELLARSNIYLLESGVALCTGTSFYMMPQNIQGLQNVVFSIFLLTQLFSTIDQQVIPHLVENRDLFEAQEYKSRTYSWSVFVASNILVELVWQSFSSVLVFVAWYYPTGLWKNGDTSFTAVERGALTVLVAPSELPRFWIFMYRVSPLTYFVRGIAVAGLANTRVTCSSAELLHISAPADQTCEQYLGPYIEYAGGSIQEGGGHQDCRYCPVSETNQFLIANGVQVDQKWQNLGFLSAYVAFNMTATFGIYWVARIQRRNRL